VRQAPAQAEQTVELRARRAVVDSPAPRPGAVETAEDLARLAVHVLVRPLLVALQAALTFGKIRDGIGGRAVQLIREVRIVALDSIDDRAQLGNELDGNIVREQHDDSP
jgi:hypothetical protein